MVAAANIKRLYGLSIPIILLGAYIAYTFPPYFILILPSILLLTGLFLLSIESIFFLVAFCTPLSIKITFGSYGINVPDEPLMIAMLLLFIVKLIENNTIFKPIFKQNLTYAIGINLIWLLITSITSNLPVVSFKFLLSRLWVLVFGYFWGAVIFKNPKNIKRFFLAFGLGLVMVIIYTTLNHYAYGFSQKKAMLVMQPLMDDHTVYSAVCSMVLIFSFTLLFFKNSFLHKALFLGLAAFCTLGVALSYSRAAVLSLIFVFGFYFLLKWQVKFKTLIISLFLILFISAIFSNQIYQKIRLNNAASGKNLVSDIKSISNVNNDESNLERLNRWESGFRMFKEKPFFGFGPGTYQFNYSAYQRSHQMTSISTTHGDMGNTHSEYFGPLIESGVIGFLTVVMVFGVSIATLMRLYYQSNNTYKMYSLAILLSLLSYYFHGLMNNFLDQDKAAVIFWAMLGMVSALNINQKTNESLKKE